MLALIYVLAWQLQDTSRRALVSGFRYKDALWGDVISYLGQALLVGFLYLNKYTSLNRALTLMAITSLVAATLQSSQVGLARTTWNELRDSAIRFWSLGKWLAVVSLPRQRSGRPHLALGAQLVPWQRVGSAASRPL